MEKLFKILAKNKIYKQIIVDLVAGNSCDVNGLWGSSWAFFLGTVAIDLRKKSGRNSTILLITDSVLNAEECINDINIFMNDCSTLLPPLEIDTVTDTWDDYSQHLSLTERTKVLHSLLTEQCFTDDSTRRGSIVVTSIQALMQFMPSPKTIENNSLLMEAGKEYEQETLIEWMKVRGLEHVTLVESPGEFSLKGCIVDVFPYSAKDPYRIEFFGDEIDSIREFDPDTQISTREIKSCKILALKNESAEDHKSGHGTILTYLPKDALVVLKDESAVFANASSLIPESGLKGLTISHKGLMDELEKFRKINISTMNLWSTIDADNKKKSKNRKGTTTLTPDKISQNKATQDTSFSFNIKSLDEFNLGLKFATEKLKDVCEKNKQTVIFCNNEAEIHRFHEILGNKELEDDQKLELKVGHINHGFQFIDIAISLLSYNEVFKRYDQKRAVKKSVKAKPIESFIDLQIGDYVVHVVHGIARFGGIKEIDTAISREPESQIFGQDSFQQSNKDGSKREYLVLEFTEKSIVYVPASNIDLVQKYIGPSEHKPRLSKIGSKSWGKKKEYAQKAINDMADELLNLQAARGTVRGIACKEDNEWQDEFEGAFIYQETEDQLIVAKEIKDDIEASMPMDRLICGDVGYGKTELAMRAAFKVVMNGRQVAVLVPTTILAQQHFRTFTERMADYPVTIDVLSRFRTKKEQKEILELAAAGSVDIVIGTHRLVQKDVLFKDIGLVIIDEEQKFGVRHKEQLKRLRTVVDVLTLTATPIPRTLHMAMLGLRDISSLNTPPPDRKSVQTRIIKFQPDLIRQIIVHELNRNGQVFFVHNRVYNIEKLARKIENIVPEARTVIAHGQMPEKLLEQRMQTFVNGDADVLISTTIIESGVDIPNVNTILINEADLFGLADLHQLRGRVGRYKHRAYAYLILPTNRPITPEAEKKLKILEEFSSLGAGFKIAMRDLEIRGAGNFIGGEQHGHLTAIGYEMYCRLLETTVKKLKKLPQTVEINVSLNMGISAYLPNEYVSDHSLKMEIYRQLSRLQDVKDVDEAGRLIRDRFGPLADPVKNLLLETEVKIAAFYANIRSMTKINSTIIIEHIDFTSVENALGRVKGSLRFINNTTINLMLDKSYLKPEKALLFLRDLLVKDEG